jgi:hypothetical protein
MSKSTPLSSLPSLQENQQPSGDSNAYNENENQLVNEILQEIEGKQPLEGAGSPQNQQAPPEVQPSMPMPSPQMAQPNQMGMAPISQEEMMQRQMQRQAMMRAQMSQMEEEHDLSFQERIISMLKLPAVVAVICVLLALPQVTNVLNGFLLGKEALAKYSNILVPLIKGLLGAGLYFGASQTL